MEGMALCKHEGCPYIAATGGTLCVIHEAEAATGQQIGVASLGVKYCMVPGCGRRMTATVKDVVDMRSKDVCAEHEQFWLGAYYGYLNAKNVARLMQLLAVLGWSAAIALALVWRLTT